MALVTVGKKTDSEIQQDVLRELKWDTRVEETDVGVEVDAGVDGGQGGGVRVVQHGPVPGVGVGDQPG